MENEKICKTCGAKYQAKGYWRRLDCPECVNKASREKYRTKGDKKPFQKKICGSCGKEYLTRYKETKYCFDCRFKEQRTRAKETLRKKGFEIFINKFHRKLADEFEYISGYNGCDSIILIKCLKCNEIIQKNAQIVRKDRNVICSSCVAIQKKEKDESKELLKKALLEKRIAKQEARKIMQEKKRKQREYLLSQEKPRECPSCNNTFKPDHFRQKYCTKLCEKREQNRRKEIRRRERLKRNGYVDYSITLGKLIKRDKGICKICGGFVDQSVYSNHDNYPSIDHIIPVSKGGTHTWDNVQLAHRKCNREKRDMLAEKEQVI